VTHLPPPAHWQIRYPLSRITTWRIGGPARFHAAPTTFEQLRRDLLAARRMGIPVLALGGGSNLLFPDEGYPGLVLRLPHPAEPVMPPRAEGGKPVLVTLAAGRPLAAEVRRLAAAGWGGLEWAEGIPGTVGGAIVNNAGAYGGTIAGILESVEVVLPDGATEDWAADRLEFAYRFSALKNQDPTRAFLTAARFRLEPTSPEELEEKVSAIRDQRASKLPREPSCGCVFRNPPGGVAGKLIEDVGLAGHQIGGARVSPQHANFIINAGGATARDVREMIELIRARVRAQSGHQLQLEVQVIGAPLADPDPDRAV